MKFIPLLFPDAMATANMEGRKNQTRRMSRLDKINEHPDKWEFHRIFDGHAKFTAKNDGLNDVYIKCPYGQPGDIIWQRETACYIDFLGEDNGWVYQASENGQDWAESSEGWRWTPSIHMPKVAYRCKAMQTHPDRGGTNAQFNEVQQAYEKGMAS